jgi:hypothetical protein
MHIDSPLPGQRPCLCGGERKEGGWEFWMLPLSHVFCNISSPGVQIVIYNFLYSTPLSLSFHIF